MQYNDFLKDFVLRTKENNITILKSGGYEITQLINSIVGLLIIPKETMYNKITNNLITEDLLTKMSNCILKDEYNEKSKNNLQQLTRHLRNAVAHSKITAKSKKSREITHIKFEDRNTKNPKEYFSIEIDVDLLKEFLDAFSNAVIQLCK